MSLPTAHLSYMAEFDVLDKAASAKKGFRLEFPTRDEALYYRLRLNAARRAMRMKNKEVYEPGDPLYGSSEYDSLVIRLKEGLEDNWWLYIEKNDVFSGHMEELE